MMERDEYMEAIVGLMHTAVSAMAALVFFVGMALLVFGVA
jgi:hypothetical protein